MATPFTISVWLLLPCKPVIAYRNSKAAGGFPPAGLIHADHFALANDLGMSAISVCRRKLKPYIDNRRGLEDTLRSKQDAGMTDVFRLRLNPFWALW